MKYSIGILTTITLITAFVLSACDNRPNKVEKAEASVIEAERDLEIAKSEVEAELRLYRAENEELIKEYNRTIYDIKQKIENESDLEVREKLQSKLDKLEKSHRALKREMDNYQVSGKENWDEFKESFSDRMDELGNSLEAFFSTPATTSSKN